MSRKKTSGSTDLSIGALVDMKSGLNDVTRRRFLKGLGLAGTGIVGLRRAIGLAYGQEPDGVPLVLTDDIYDDPDRVRIVSKERYRRLQVYGNLDVDALKETHSVINSVGITQRSDNEDDLALQLYLDESTVSERLKLPNQVQDVPVEYEVFPMEISLEDAAHGHSVCDARHNRWNSMRGGLAVGPRSTRRGGGTSGLVAFDRFNDRKILVTSDHVMSSGQYDTSEYMYQPDRKHSNARRVGNVRFRDPKGMDMTSYTLRSGIGGKPRVTVRHDVPDVTGTWNFYGLSSETSPGSVNCKLTGARHCLIRDACIDTVKFNRLNYTAVMQRHSTRGGDSGAPWVDSRGKLLAIHRGSRVRSGRRRSIGGIGRHALNAVEAKLSR